MMTENSTRIAQAFFHIGRASAGLPFSPLLPVQRQALGGRLFPEGACFVEAVAEALGGSPESAEIAGHQAEADAWSFLRVRLLALGQLAADGWLFHQAEAIRKAQAAAERAREDAARQLALLPAALVWHAFLAVQQQQKAKKRQERAAATPTPAPAGRPRARHDHGKTGRRDAMHRLFEALRRKRLRELGQEHIFDEQSFHIDDAGAGGEDDRAGLVSEVADGRDVREFGPGSSGGVQSPGPGRPRRIF